MHAPQARDYNRNWHTPQLVCVSAVDDTDKSSESVDKTTIEHVLASTDTFFDHRRIMLPVKVSDSDGYYLWSWAATCAASWDERLRRLVGCSSSNVASESAAAAARRVKKGRERPGRAARA